MNNKILDFYEFIYDRQNLAHRKSIDKRPWTRDQVLYDYKFCNVRRKEDACSQHLINQVHKNDFLTPEDVLFNIILFRRFNVRYFYTDLIKPPPYVRNFDEKTFEHRLDECKTRGFKLFNDAYTICQIPYNMHYRPTDKHVQILLSMKDISISADFYDLVNPMHAKDFFYGVQFKGKHLIGPFLAYQILIDWSYYRRMDGLNDFVCVGPGAIGGLEIIYGDDLYREERCRKLCEMQEYGFRILLNRRKKDWFKVCGKEKKILLSDIENCLCEYRKYHKLKNGIKTRIRRYKGR